MIAEIRKLYEEMKDKCISLKMPRSVVAYRPENLQLCSEEQLTAILAWVRATHKIQYKHLLKARGLVTEDTWAFYESMEVKNLQEQNALSDALSIMRKCFEERPSELKKGWKPDKSEAYHEKLRNRSKNGKKRTPKEKL